MFLEGVATIVDDSRAVSVDVFLDLVQGRCIIYENSASSFEGFLGFFLATKDHFFLEKVSLRTGDSKFLSEKLGPFFLSSITQAEPVEDKDISSSSLAIALGVNPNVVGVDEVEIKPFNSRIEFQVVNSGIDDGSEILFYCDPRVKFDCSIELNGKKVRVHTFRPGTVLSKYVRCYSSSLDISKYANELRMAVSLFLRRRAFIHFVRSQSKVSLNLSLPDQAISYGVLVHDPRHYKEVLEKLITASLRSRSHFLIEAFSNPGTLEVRLLNAFVHLEIIDGGKTLSGNRVASALKIKRDNADALICMRNVMIHDGLGAVSYTHLTLPTKRIV